MKKLFSILFAITLTLSMSIEACASRLPVAGEKNWGTILNEFLLVAHNADGTLTPNSVALTNKSGGAVAQYDVVVVGTAFDNSFNTTTTAGNVNVIGVAQEAIADNAAGDVLPPSALTTVNIKAGVTIVRGDYLITSTVAGKADRSATHVDGSFARALTGGTGTVSAILINQAEPLDTSTNRTITANWDFAPTSGNTVFSAGNVGINNASPSATLDITGTLAISSTSLVTNLNADLLDGISSAGFEQIGALVRAYRATTVQTITTSTETLLEFNAESWDTGNNFASFYFTAPRTGYYMVTGQVTWPSTLAVGRYDTRIYAGTLSSEALVAYVIHDQENTGGTGALVQVFSDVVYITSGQVIKIKVYQNTGANRDITYNASQTFINIREINRVP